MLDGSQFFVEVSWLHGHILNPVDQMIKSRMFVGWVAETVTYKVQEIPQLYKEDDSIGTRSHRHTCANKRYDLKENHQR